MKESLTSYIRLQTLIKEALSNPTKKKDCNCGCGGCGDKLINEEISLHLPKSLLMEALSEGIDKSSVKKGIEGVSKLLNINPNELSTTINKIQKAEKEGNKEELEQLQQNLTKKLEEGIGLAIAILSLVPKVLDLTGRGINTVKRKIPSWIGKEEQVKAEKTWAIIKSKEKTLEGLKKTHDTFTDLAKQKPSAYTKPKYVEAYKRYVEVVKEYQVLKKEIYSDKKAYDKEFGAGLGNWMKKAGHTLHEWYIKPFEGILWVLGWTGLWPKMRNKNSREKAANIFYSLTMITLAGSGVLSHISHLHGIADVAAVATELADGAVSFAAAAETALEIADLAT